MVQWDTEYDAEYELREMFKGLFPNRSKFPCCSVTHTTSPCGEGEGEDSDDEAEED